MAEGMPRDAGGGPGALLERLFASISEAGIAYCVLRNYETLPASVPGSDIDLLVAPGRRGTVERLLMERASALGWRLERRYPKTYRIAHLRLVRPVPNDRPEFLRFDLMDHVGMGPLRFYAGDGVLRTRRRVGAVSAPSPGMEHAINLLNAAYDGHPLKSAYREKAAALAKGGGELERELARCVGDRLAARMIDTLGGNGPQALRRAVRRRLWRRAWSQRPLATLADCLGYLAVAGRRLLAPPGTMAVVLGPDGIGKSTVVGTVAEALSKAFPGVVVGHLRPWLLPRLGYRLVGTGAGARPTRDTREAGGDSEPSPGVVISVLRLGYAGLDYILGYWLRVYPALIKGRLVIFDRYYHDFFVDTRQKGVELPHWLLRAVCRLFPSPHRVFVLAADGNTVYSRRRDLSVAEAERQILAYKALARDDPAITIVDASGGVEEIANSICRGILAGEERSGG